MRKLMVLILVVAVAALLLSSTACGGSSSADTGQANASDVVTQSSQSTASDAIDWSEASSHVGETTTVEGPVAGAMYADTSNGEPTFLNVGVDYPDSSRFTVVIWGEDRGSFSQAPEDMYSGRTIRVTGTVSEYEGIPEIEVSGPDEIEVVE